jgi:DNA repair protein SbcD/Mre11
MSIRFIHTADTHFGVENYGYIDKKTGLHSRLLDFKKSFEYCIEYAIENDVDCFVFAGDAYKNNCPSPTHQRVLLKLFTPLIDAKIPIIIVIGNHDSPGNFSKANALDVFNHLNCDGCYLFSRPGKIEIQTKGGPIQFVCIPWPSRSKFQNQNNFTTSNDVSKNISLFLKDIISRYAISLKKHIPAVLVSHMAVSSGIFSGSERAVVIGRDPVLSVSDVAIEPFDYVALGHLHRYQNLNLKGDIPVVYSGSPDRIDFGEVSDLKGFCDVKIFDKKDVNCNFVKTPTRPFIDLYFESFDENKILCDFERILGESNVAGAIVRIKYSLPVDAVKVPPISIFHDLLKDAFYIADIKCLNARRAIRDGVMKINRDQSIESMILEYCNQKPEHEKYINDYISLIQEYSI